ncbi:hypothetical protein F5B22DRAFT_407287 [Xylaria bambusicola]|uniref:uncharacterized protein n=1 Tax=Xylaria bambusicola TaxID=326684 RepID=UPI0020089ABF|nr:uncharacterized protein F5B22DRAFT_407287 [Xylaria bambusicola]KAI0523641.1 hypothetical protein F5B22DRAFT_407287 [Xylaria bambusicola]
MANRPPGFEQAAEDVVCYNCGTKGHIFFACPEDTRPVPAGLEASRKRQASGNDYHAPTKRSKRPVVTHYPPPPPPNLPHIPPPPISYSPRPGYEAVHSSPLPGPPTSQPYYQSPPLGHYDQYVPPGSGRSTSRGAPRSNSRDVLEQNFQGPPRAPPPETSYRPPHFDRYDQHRPEALPYSRPYSAPPDRYDEQYPRPSSGLPYGAVHHPPHPAHFEHYPPAPGVESYFSGPQQPYPPPPPNVLRNPPQHGYDGISQVHPYIPGHEPPPEGNHSYQSHQYPPTDMSRYHTRYDDHFTDHPSYERQRRDHRTQHRERRSGDNRHNRERYGRRRRGDSPKGRSRSERRFPDQPARLASPSGFVPPAKSATNSTSLEDSKPEKEFNETVPVDIKNLENHSIDDFSWAEEAIFKEPPVKITKDLIKEPLPAEWTDEPIMPPKYDKETITSKYINSTNVDDFALSVRETKEWQIAQFHPAFLAPTDVRIDKLWDYERAFNSSSVYNKQNRHGISSGASGKQREKSSIPRTRRGRQARYPQQSGQNSSQGEDQRSYQQMGPTNSGWDKANYRDVKEEIASLPKKPRIYSPEPGEVCESDDEEPTTTNKTATPSWEEDYHHKQRNFRHSGLASLHDYQIGAQEVVSKGDTRRSSTPDAVTSAHQAGYISDSPSRAPSTRSSHHDDFSRPPSRHSSRSNPSQPSSRRSSTGSPLTPTERELLGMQPYSSDSDSGQESSIRQTGAVKRQRQQPAKLHAAYQRRW